MNRGKIGSWCISDHRPQAKSSMGQVAGNLLPLHISGMEAGKARETVSQKGVKGLQAISVARKGRTADAVGQLAVARTGSKQAEPDLGVIDLP